MDNALTYELDERVNLLEIQNTDTVYSWASKKTIWAKAEPQTSKNLFSSVGMGVKSVKFTVWKQNLTLHNAFRWRGKHCFLTDITEIDRLYYEVTAALIEPKTCYRLSQEESQDELLRPVDSEPKIDLTFPACLVEKYMGFQQLNPQARVTEQYVLVTPKEITLTHSGLVQIGETVYSVQVIHDLDEFKNEYEIDKANKDC